MAEEDECEEGDNGGPQVVDAEQLARILTQTKKPKIKWSEAVIKLKDEISELKPDDRLSYASAIEDLVRAISFSMAGWNEWLRPKNINVSGLKTMNNMSMKEFEKAYGTLRKCAQEILDIDFTISSTKEKEAEAKIKEHIEKEKKKEKEKRKSSRGEEEEKTRYVA